jgi:phage terminase large subunit-like protein
LILLAYDTKAKQVRLVGHRVFQPTPDQVLNFETTIEATLLELARRFQMRKILFDPYQMMASSQRLAQAGLPIEEFPQSPTNLTAASQNLYELINTQSIVCYPDSGMRLAVSRAIALETGRGWRIAKEKQAHKIDIVVALAMACYAAVKAQSEPFFDQSWSWVSGPPDKADPHNLDAWRALRTSLYYQTGGAYRLW